MKNYFIILIMTSSLFLSCEHSATKQDTIEMADAIVLDTAKGLIRHWIYNDYNPNMNPSMEFSVKEITSNDILNKLGGQVFVVICEVPGLVNRALFIKNRKVYDLGEHNLYGAGESESMVVTDLDNNNAYELCFVLTHGSGILRTDIICYINDIDTSFKANCSFLFPLDYKIMLHSANYNSLNVVYSKNDEEIGIGAAKLSETGKNTKFVVELNDNVPADLKKNISIRP